MSHHRHGGNSVRHYAHIGAVREIQRNGRNQPPGPLGQAPRPKASKPQEPQTALQEAGCLLMALACLVMFLGGCIAADDNTSVAAGPYLAVGIPAFIIGLLLSL